MIPSTLNHQLFLRPSRQARHRHGRPQRRHHLDLSVQFDLLSTITTPNPGTLGGSPQTTITYYNPMLQATNVVQPDGTSVTSEYYPTGQLKRQYGSAPTRSATATTTPAGSSP